MAGVVHTTIDFYIRGHKSHDKIQFWGLDLDRFLSYFYYCSFNRQHRGRFPPPYQRANVLCANSANRS